MKKRKKVWLKILIINIVGIIAIGLLNFNNVAKFMYPFPYKEIIEQASEQFGVDQYLILSVMKAESKFKEDAVSSKGALGLMQIMPETGIWIAQQLKLQDFSPEQLLDPEVNILMGTWYLTYLMGEFNNRLPLTLASYNAGPGNTKRWLDQMIWDGTYTNVEQVPFNETRRYVKKVLTNYERYYRIYE